MSDKLERESSIGKDDAYVNEAAGPAVLEDGYADVDERSARAKLSDYFTILASGAALISDGYQNALASIFNPIFKLLHKPEYDSTVQTRVSNAMLVGAVLGQVIVGVFCDRVGRKTAMVGTTLLIVLGGILATASNGKTPEGMFWMLTVARGVTGLGVGGEYPACSTSASEAANEKFGRDRGKFFILVTNLMLTLGSPIVIILFLVIVKGSHFKGNSSAHDLYILNYTWRILFAIGVLIPLTVFYFRLKMDNPKLYKRNALKKSMPMGVYWLVIKRYWKTLIGTAGTWFLYDFVVFPNGVFSSTIIAQIIPGKPIDRIQEWNLLLAILGIPGILIGAWVVKYTGRKNILMIGFSGYIVFGLIVGCAYEKIIKITPLFVIFYGLMQSSGGLGPGNMEGTISSESYPTSIRGTCYGLSAAIGKVGAVCGTYAFTPIQENLGKKYTFIIAACCGVTGVALTFFFVTDKGRDKLEKEDEAWRQYLVENGYEDLVMGDGSEDTTAAQLKTKERLEWDQ